MVNRCAVVSVHRSYLAIPPPSQQRAMHEPCLDAEICEGGQVGLDEVGQR